MSYHFVNILFEQLRLQSNVQKIDSVADSVSVTKETYKQFVLAIVSPCTQCKHRHVAM